MFVINEKLAIMNNVIHNQFSPRYINPDRLYKILKGIHSSLPAGKTLALGYEYKDLLDYYRKVQCFLLNRGTVSYIMSIFPIVIKDVEYEMFEVLSLPMPSSSEIGGYQMYVQPDFSKFGLSKSRDRFFVVKNTDVSICLTNSYCAIRDPIYFSNDVHSCALGSLIHGIKYFNEFCSVHIKRPGWGDPFVFKISKYQWLVIPQEPVTFSILCKSKTFLMTMNPPFSYLKLSKGCSAFNNKLVLLEEPGIFHNESYIPPPIDTFFSKSEALWLNFSDSYVPGGRKWQHVVGKLEKMGHGDFVGLSDLQREVADINEGVLGHWDVFKNSGFPYLVVIVLVVLVLVLFIFLGLKLRGRMNRVREQIVNVVEPQPPTAPTDVAFEHADLYPQLRDA